MAELQQVHDEPEPDLNHDLERLVDGIKQRLQAAVYAGTPDDKITEAIDQYIDSFISNWRGRMLSRHRHVLNRLDVLEVRVKPYLDRSDALHADDLSRLDHLDGAVSHALDRVADPDTPFMDPLPRQRRRDG
jgi:hypothetical protein